jgi:hypothetical protein
MVVKALLVKFMIKTRGKGLDPSPTNNRKKRAKRSEYKIVVGIGLYTEYIVKIQLNSSIIQK